MKANSSMIHRVKTISLASLLGTFLLVSRADAGGTITWPVPPPAADANPAATAACPLNGWLAYFEQTYAAARATPDAALIFDGENFATSAGWHGGPGGMAARFAKYKVLDLGSQMETTQTLLWRLQQGEADNLHPKLIVLMIGSTNLGTMTPEQAVEGVRADIAEYQKRCPGAVILLLGSLPRGEKPTDPFRAKIKAFDDALAPLADGKNVLYLNFGDKVLQPDGTISRQMLTDFVHVGPQGYKAWADAIMPIVEKYVPANATPPPTADAATVPAQTASQPQGTFPWPAPEPAAGANPATIPTPPMSWLPHFQQNLDDSRKMSSVDLIFDGDSITYGWRGSAGGGIWNKGYAPLNAYDFGISGDGTQGLLWRLENGQVDGLHPKLIVLLIGTNNMYSSSAEQIAGGIKAVVQKYREKCPDATVLVQGIFPRGEKPTDPLRAKVKSVNEMIAPIADGKHLIFLDFGSKLLDAEGNYTKPITGDFLHPNGPGYAIWADAIQPMIDKYFPGKSGTTNASAVK